MSDLDLASVNRDTTVTASVEKVLGELIVQPKLHQSIRHIEIRRVRLRLL